MFHLIPTGRLAAGAALLALAAVAHAADRLPLDEAQRLAVQRSYQIPAYDAAIAASTEMGAAAARLPDPVLKVGIDNLPLSGPDRASLGADAMTMRRVGVMQELTRADKRALRGTRYAQEAARTQAEKDKAIAAVERNTALAWLDRHYADATVTILAEQRTLAVQEREVADAAYRGGRGSQSDVLAAQSAVLQLDDRVLEAQGRARAAGAGLARWLGDAAARPLADPPAMDAIRLDATTLETQLAHHPDIAVLARQADIAETQAGLAEADRRPDWSVEVTYQQRGAAYPNMVSVGLSVPLHWDRNNRQDRELAARLAMASQARGEQDEALRAHAAEIRAQIAAWQTGRARQARYSADLVPLAQARSAALLAAYRGGKASLADVLAARRNVLDTRLAALQLEADTARIWAQLNFLFPMAQAGGHP